MIKNLIKSGNVERLSTGEEGVRVSLQYELKLTEPSRSARLNILRAKFECIAKQIKLQGAEVDLNSISVSGQTVEAILPIDRWEQIFKKLSEEKIRVDLLIDRQIL